MRALKPGERDLGGYWSLGPKVELSCFARCGIASLGRLGRIEGGLRWSFPMYGGGDLKWQIIEENKSIPGIALLGEYLEGTYVESISPAGGESYPFEAIAGSIIFSKALFSKVNLFTGYKYVYTQLFTSTGERNKSLIESDVHTGFFIASELKLYEESGVIIGVTYLRQNKLEIFKDWLKYRIERFGYGILPKEITSFTVAGYHRF